MSNEYEFSGSDIGDCSGSTHFILTANNYVGRQRRFGGTSPPFPEPY